MDHDDDKGKGQGYLGAILLALLIPFFYVLSLGPAVMVYDDCPPPVQKSIEAVFFPLVWLADNTPLREPLNRYVELWRR